MPIKEFHLSRVLSELDFTQDEFIDLCILLGCDYCDSIRGIGPKRAVDLIKQHRCIEEVIKHLDTKKYTIPENWPYEQARKLFKEPEVSDDSSIQLKWVEPNEKELIEFMVNDKGFNMERIQNGCKKLAKARHGSTQGRLDDFFKVIPSASTKRKSDEGAKGGPSKKKGKGGFKRPR